MPKILENRLIEEFKERKSFSREELFEFFKFFEPDLKEGTFGWRVYDLKKKNIIKHLRRGFYTISSKPEYKPGLSDELLKLAKKLNERFADVRFCIWDTDWLNEFSRHQAGKRIIIVEVERDFLDSFFYEIKEIQKKDVYLSPDEKAITMYVAESVEPVVIKRLVTRSPVSKRSEKKLNFYIPLLEKMLVDTFTDYQLFYYTQGTELIHIFETAISNYDLNFTKFLSYAKRRGKDSDIKMFIKKNIPHLDKDSVDV